MDIWKLQKFKQKRKNDLFAQGSMGCIATIYRFDNFFCDLGAFRCPPPL